MSWRTKMRAGWAMALAASAAGIAMYGVEMVAWTMGIVFLAVLRGVERARSRRSFTTG